MKTLKIIMIDYNDVFRNALKSLLIKEYNFTIIGEASNNEEVKQISSFREADIIFIDLMMPELNGLQFTKDVLFRYPNMKFVAVSMYVEHRYIMSLIEAGFVGCIPKNNLIHEVKSAIGTVMNGDCYFPQVVKI